MNWLQPLAEVTLLGLVPLILLGTGKIKGRYRFGVLAASGLLMIADVLIFKIPATELGLRLDNLAGSLSWYLGFATIGVLSVLIYSRLKHIAPVQKWWQDPHFLFWFIPISLGQQFIFFGFLQSRFQSFLPAGAAIIISAAIFASAHLMYRPRQRAVIITFLGGLGFALLFMHTPNLILGSIVHMILNLAVVQRNTFVFSKPDA
ncbi:MAG: CPBP family glutamic-type intramembrane protease [Patescibacteria group bacterium]|jgi:membrane protease YdiL (CAAX protease family)